jgi:iron complex outermembrane receptor protein
VNGDVYYYDYAGYQTAAINTSPDTPANPTFQTITVPMKSYGAELEIQARPWQNGTISLNGSYTNARYGSFGEYASLFSKNDVPGVPPFQGAADYDHRLAIGSTTLLLHADVRVYSAHDTSSITQQFQAFGGEPYVHVATEAVGDFNATLLFGEHYSITAYVRNIADNRYIPDGWGVASVVPGAVAGGPPQTFSERPSLSDPRTIGIILSFKE